MNAQTPKSATVNRTSFFVAAGLIAACSVFAALAYTLQTTGPANRAAIVSLSNLPDGSTGNVRLESAAGARSYTIDSVTPFVEYDGQMPTLPYRLYATIRLPDDIYRDFTLTVGKAGIVSAIVDGFDAWDPITLSLNGQPVFQRTPADWSGKLELQANLPEGASARACLEINSATGTIRLCHNAPERRGT